MQTCVQCGISFRRNTRGRPAKKCEQCRAKYGAAYKQLRAATKEDAIGTACRRCGLPMLGTDLDLGHDDQSGEISGWEHSVCNRSAGAHKGNAQRRAANGRAPTGRQLAGLRTAGQRPPAPGPLFTPEHGGWGWDEDHGGWVPVSRSW
jgi:hypothetical protein